MRYYSIRFTIVIMFIVFVLTSWAQRGRKSPGNWWQLEEIQKSISLTEKQIKDIESLYTTWTDERKELAKQMNDVAPVMQNAVLKNLPDEELTNVIDKYFDLRKKIILKSIIMRKKIKTILNQKQVEKLLADYPKLFSLSTSWQPNHRQQPETKKGNVIIKREGKE